MTTTAPTVWTCDACGDDITDPSQAWVLFRRDADGKDFDFHIVHHNDYGKRCDPPAMPASIQLSELLGPAGLSELLSFLSPGPINGGSRVTVADMNEFVDLVRRIQVPWYEQARKFWNAPQTREWFDAGDTYAPYLPENLERIAPQPVEEE